ncbi:MAG: hypothetical protein LC772_07230, partial [Chloroflexi bacterium]|nr:hypothetical protein [Chloroflexota bacterium]
MTLQTTTSQAALAEKPVPTPAARDAAHAPARIRPRFDPRYIAPLLITCILLVANFTEGVLESPWKTVLAIAVSIVVEMGAARLAHGKWPHLASAYVTGISVGILVRSPMFWPYAVCAALSILSKYVLR